MPRGGKRPGAGRKKGGVTKATVYRQEMLARATAEGISPLEVILTAMRNAWDAKQIEEAVSHAVHAAPYVHPRLASSAVTVDDKRSADQFTDAELEAVLTAGSSRIAEASEGESESHGIH